MSSLSEQLKALGVEVGTSNLPVQSKGNENEFPISSVLSGDWWHTPHGDNFYVETMYKSDFQVGNVKISPLESLDVIAAWAREPELKETSLEDFVFIDTETTGLAGGTGTYTFLIGAGRFVEDHFQLVQFFLTEPGEEVSQLAAFEEFISPCTALVSFNGKAFDVPLINTRYIINGWPSPIGDLPHIDLLHLARRLWKDRLPSRALGDLEWYILGLKRSEQDVPGWMIADLYFDYLHTGDARPLRGVFYHNEIDVLSLAALLSHMSILISDPLNGLIEHGQDMAAIGKLYADLGNYQDAVKLYQHALEFEEQNPEGYWESIKRLSYIHKKLGDLKAAKSLWKRAAQQDQVYACEELAKLYEHTDRDFPEALYWTEFALDIISKANDQTRTKMQWEKSLTHRKKRLQRKLIRLSRGDYEEP